MNRLGNLWPTQRLLIGLIRLIHLLILNPFRAGVINYENGSSWCSQTGGRCQDKEDEIQEESNADLFANEAKGCLEQINTDQLWYRTYPIQRSSPFLFSFLGHAASS